MRVLCVFDPPGADWRRAAAEADAHGHSKTAFVPLSAGGIARCPERGRLLVEVAGAGGGAVELTVGATRAVGRLDGPARSRPLAPLELAPLGRGTHAVEVRIDRAPRFRMSLEVVEGR